MLLVAGLGKLTCSHSRSKRASPFAEKGEGEEKRGKGGTGEGMEKKGTEKSRGEGEV